MDSKTEYSKKFLNALTLETRKIINEKIPIKKVFTDQQKYENRLKAKKSGKELDDEYPFVLIRPHIVKQSFKNGVAKKVQQYLFRVGIINNTTPEEGYFEVAKYGDKIIRHYTNKPLATMSADGYSYHVNLGEEIIAYLNEELTADEYWTYDVIISFDIPADK